MANEPENLRGFPGSDLLAAVLSRPVVVSVILLAAIYVFWQGIEARLADVPVDEYELYTLKQLLESNRPFALEILAPIIAALSVVVLIRVKSELTQDDADWVTRKIKDAHTAGYSQVGSARWEDRVTDHRKAALARVRRAVEKTELNWGYGLLAIGFAVEAGALLVNEYMWAYLAAWIMAAFTAFLVLLYWKILPGRANRVRIKALKEFGEGEGWPSKAMDTI